MQSGAKSGTLALSRWDISSLAPLGSIGRPTLLGSFWRGLVSGPFLFCLPGRCFMPDSCAGFIDAGFLSASGAEVLQQRTTSVRPDARVIVAWFHCLVEREFAGQTFLRAYWYDGVFDPSPRDYAGQRTFSMQLRKSRVRNCGSGILRNIPQIETPIRRALERTAVDLGLSPDQLLTAYNQQWQFRPERRQKGVDTLIALDMVRLASHSVYTTAVLIAGDRDLAEAIRAAQDYGARVVVATSNRHGVAEGVKQLANGLVDITEDDLRAMRPVRTS